MILRITQGSIHPAAALSLTSMLSKLDTHDTQTCRWRVLSVGVMVGSVAIQRNAEPGRLTKLPYRRWWLRHDPRSPSPAAPSRRNSSRILAARRLIKLRWAQEL